METNEILETINRAARNLARIPAEAVGHPGPDAAARACDYAFSAMDLAEAAYQLARLASNAAYEAHGAAMASGDFERATVQHYARGTEAVADRARDEAWTLAQDLRALGESAQELFCLLDGEDSEGAGQ